jgi:DNA repair photolyase
MNQQEYKEMRKLKNGLSIRGDHYYCPLSLQLDTYWNCSHNCIHCYLRRMNRTWGQEQRVLDLEAFSKRIENAPKNKDPKTMLAQALKTRKTIRVGNKTDPFQPIEKRLGVTSVAIEILLHFDWSIVIQTKNTGNISEVDKIRWEHKKHLVSIMPIISPGLEKDWEVFERSGTTHPIDRMRDLKWWLEMGFNGGVNGEPFIPGYHTTDDFRKTLKLLKAHGIKSYNTYNLHMNDLVAKNLHEAGLDIERIWYYNQDDQWRPILRELIEIAKEEDIILGCPDFINSGRYIEEANTCCGIDVPNPFKNTAINWKRKMMQGYTDKEEILDLCWDGVGDPGDAIDMLQGRKKDFYSLKDIKWD